MRIHYMGKYNLDPESLPHGDHMPGAVKFKEASTTKELAVIANILSLAIFIILLFIAIMRSGKLFFDDSFQWTTGCLFSLLMLFPHELLHAICFKEDVYLYTNLAQGMLFVTGVESMSKSRYVFMSLLPNIVFGLVPYIIGLIFPNLIFFVVFGIISISMGTGDYYNTYNAITQMPKGAKTYLYQFNSYWYMP